MCFYSNCMNCESLVSCFFIESLSKQDYNIGTSCVNNTEMLQGTVEKTLSKSLTRASLANVFAHILHSGIYDG
ncbi:hypothetical protein Syun_022852 [Stephania yunnanensis]|uniref:Uncharacterized protein n=1 Tax=Stephania yunnanensis TaxID=152371 RepID=A0AAP0F8Q1_9MAGN